MRSHLRNDTREKEERFYTRNKSCVDSVEENFASFLMKPLEEAERRSNFLGRDEKSSTKSS